MRNRRCASARDLDGVIDLERLRSGSPTSLERDVAGFLELTWPSSDVLALVRGTSGTPTALATGETLYDALWDGLELVWQHTVQAILSDRPVKDVDRPLEGKRFRVFGPDETPPEPGPGLCVDRRCGLAMLAGGCHNRPKGPWVSRSVYRHGGLTLMEMLTLWVVLEPVT